MILLVGIHKQVFAALLHNKILPMIPNFDGEFVTRDAPKTIRNMIEVILQGTLYSEDAEIPMH